LTVVYDNRPVQKFIVINYCAHITRSTSLCRIIEDQRPMSKIFWQLIIRGWIPN